MPRIADTARATIARHDLLPAGAPVLALVSGGADSVALLRLLASGDLDPVSAAGADEPPAQRLLSVLHVNHQLRGADADADAAFVATLCETLGVPCTVVRFDVAAFAEEAGLNLEDAGRQIRYRFAAEELAALCAANRVRTDRGRIATAHTRDDRVETFLMRVITGAGAGGFASIPYRRDAIVRPLLDCDREALRGYLRDIGQEWREDATNADTTRMRSMIRHDLVPLFEAANPAFRETLSRSIDLLADDDALLTTMATAFTHDFADVAPGHVEFDRELMATLERTMARRTIRTAVLEAFPDASRIEAAHIEALVDGLTAENFARDLPGGLRAESRYAKLVVSRAGDTPCAVAPSLLPIPGTADLGPAGLIHAELVDPADIAGDADSVTIAIGDIERLVVDAPRPGDRMRPLGMEGSRKLSDLLVDAKVARSQRPGTPVVRDGERIVWLGGVRMSEEYRVGADTARAVRLTWERDEPERSCATGRRGKDD
jgi:tRNA(Ile)-lysidine synthase